MSLRIDSCFSASSLSKKFFHEFQKFSRHNIYENVEGQCKLDAYINEILKNVDEAIKNENFQQVYRNTKIKTFEKKTKKF